MPSLARYRARRAQGLCGKCGHQAAAPDYAFCPACYTPHPRVSKLFPDLAGDPLAWTAAYNWARRKQEADVELGCCGTFHAVTTVPYTTPCCGKIFFKASKEEARG